MEKDIKETINVVYQACCRHPGTLLTFQSDDIAAIINGLGGAPKLREEKPKVVAKKGPETTPEK